ncbi:16S rRNA (uracil(1498)-N(3))-methyltransferase [Lacticaseibacillus pabuli]|uniref:Ribosomal RNA small subunit methyltransferase E n=1 Tax=Lacticaseibacillus pabuli TaxID=3025672 RepID=A0ABY7WUE0_9LACO|nr:16S rRNA (uracil(1498)-N(3))-methyltransferase [Lacticaseibacillus sp. KACC 23028]WDF83773.1 16S rRNA (uracil(1498)-N(3))-methyltransferase [Lacticaseibacillus sp. KACC 23028]
MQRYFASSELHVDDSFTLDTATRRHAATVLRMQPGDQFELADSRGKVFTSTITDLDPLTVHVDEDITRDVELPVDVTIVCGVAKSQKAELITQKATELGVSRVVFANSQWGTARWEATRMRRKLERLQLIARGAAEQSHRNKIPQVDFLPKLTDAKKILADAKLIAYEESAKQGEAGQLIQTLSAHPRSLVVVFGPEGGIAPTEIEQLTAAGFKNAALGPRILRTETAPLYLLSAISALTELRKDE